MDPFSSDGELVSIHQAFVESRYQDVIDFDTSSFSAANDLPLRVLQLRAHLALHQYSTVLSSISNSEATSTPDLAALKAAASYFSGDSSSALSTAETLASTHASNPTVQILCATVLAAAELYEPALALLAQHTGSLDAVALLVQIHLLQNRADLAAREARSARTFAGDVTAVNLIESWVGMREGGEKYQQAFYVFEELAQAPSSSSAGALVAQAVSELHLQRYPEAEVALGQALEKEPGNRDAAANAVVLYTILGDVTKAAEYRAKLDGEHELVKGIVAKKGAFDAACEKYAPKFEA